MKFSKHTTIAVICAVAGLGILVLAADETDKPSVRFPHEFHFDDLGIECKQCHHETSAAKLEIPHENYFSEVWAKCKTCHQDIPAGGMPQACANCHHNSPADVADETLSAKVVIHRSCWGCHEVGRGAEASQACKSCHPKGGEE